MNTMQYLKKWLPIIWVAKTQQKLYSYNSDKSFYRDKWKMMVYWRQIVYTQNQPSNWPPNVEKNLVEQDEGASRSAKMGDNASYEKVTF